MSFTRSMSSLLFLLLSSASFASARPLPGLYRRDDVHCGNATWEDILIFFVLNYATHCATIKAFPGNKGSLTVRWAAAALLVPYSGIVRGCAAIVGARSWGESDLQHATRVGALVTLGRTRWWRPRPGEEVSSHAIPLNTLREGRGVIEPLFWSHGSSVDPEDYLIHGYIPSNLGPEYHLVSVPNDAVVVAADQTVPTRYVHIARSPTLVKSLAAIAQLAFAVVTLYRAKGHQIEQFGYAAYGLTVIPYAIMSLINLVGHLLNPDYPALFLVHSDVLDEAMKRGLQFEGMVGRLKEEKGASDKKIIFWDTQTSSNPYESVLTNFKISDSNPNAKQKPKPKSAPAKSGASRLADADITTVDVDHNGNAGGEEDAPLISSSAAMAEPSSTTVKADADPKKNKIYIPKVREIERRTFSKARDYVSRAIMLIGLIAPYVIIAVLSNWKPNDSTSLQRGFTVSWLVCGQVFGWTFGLSMQDDDSGGSFMTFFWIFTCLLVSAPAIGGFVMVAQMIKIIGNCVLVPQ